MSHDHSRASRRSFLRLGASTGALALSCRGEAPRSGDAAAPFATDAASAPAAPAPDAPASGARRLLLVAYPGVDAPAPGKVLVYDRDDGHALVDQIPVPQLATGSGPSGFKGMAACAATNRLYLSYKNRVTCIDLGTRQTVWTHAYDSGCDRLAVTPDGRKLYIPSGHWTTTRYWYAASGETGEVIAKIDHAAWAHNTIVGLDGTRAYLAAIQSNQLAVVDTRTDQVIGRVGPFGNVIRPFTVTGDDGLCFVNVNGLLGFEVGDVRTGKRLYRVTVEGYAQGPVRSHGCPSHGIALTPDETQVWVADGANHCIHVFDTATMPPRQIDNIMVADQVFWLTFSMSGDQAYTSTGEVIDTATRKVVARLADAAGAPLESEKFLTAETRAGRLLSAGDQFGVGRRRV